VQPKATAPHLDSTKGRKSHSEQIWSALPQIADIDSSREDFSVGPRAEVATASAAKPSLIAISRPNGDFANKLFRAPVKARVAT
jgi:hypothetical protein